MDREVGQLQVVGVFLRLNMDDYNKNKLKLVSQTGFRFSKMGWFWAENNFVAQPI